MKGSVTTLTLAWKSSTACGSDTAQAAGVFWSFHVVGTAMRQPAPLCSANPAGIGGAV